MLRNAEVAFISLYIKLLFFLNHNCARAALKKLTWCIMATDLVCGWKKEVSFLPTEDHVLLLLTLASALVFQHAARARAAFILVSQHSCMHSS